MSVNHLSNLHPEPLRVFMPDVKQYESGCFWISSSLFSNYRYSLDGRITTRRTVKVKLLSLKELRIF